MNNLSLDPCEGGNLIDVSTLTEGDAPLHYGNSWNPLFHDPGDEKGGKGADKAQSLIRERVYCCAASAVFTQLSNSGWWALIQPST